MWSRTEQAGAWRRPVRVLVVAPHNVFRQGLVQLLGGETGVSVVAAVEDLSEAVRQASALLPDVVLLDESLPFQDVTGATAELANVGPEVRVLVLSASHSDEVAVAAVRAGAAGYLTVDVDAATLVAEIRRVAEGRLAIGHETLRAVVAAATGNTTPVQPPEGLTNRQFEILRRMAKGMSLKQIGRDLGVAEKTIRNQASLMYRKLRVHDHVEAVLYALRKGVVG